MRISEFVADADDVSAVVLPQPPRVVPAIPYRRDLEPFWLQLKDIADRLIAAAGYAEENALAWHPTDAPVRPGT
jgi:hypothetical protein